MMRKSAQDDKICIFRPTRRGQAYGRCAHHTERREVSPAGPRVAAASLGTEHRGGTSDHRREATRDQHLAWYERVEVGHAANDPRATSGAARTCALA